MYNNEQRTRRLIRGLQAASTVLAFIAVAAFGIPALAAGPFAAGFPSDPSFFPIGVWLQSPDNAPEYKRIGINTFVGLWEGPTEAQLAVLAKYGMFAVAEQNDVALTSVNRNVIRAWTQPDEPDNSQYWLLGYGPCIPAVEVSTKSRAIRLRDTTRPIYIGFGRGVADPTWPGRGRCTGDQDYYAAAAIGADILSFDIYPVGSDTPHVKGKLEYVASGVDFLVKRATPQQRVWTTLETTALDPKRPVTPDELRTEVWMALIHGATGIVYFVDEWVGGFREDGVFRHPEIVRAIANIDHTITELAPILNSPSVSMTVKVTSEAPVDLMTRERDGYLYIFAVVMRDEAAIAEFTIPGLGNSIATVLDADGTIPIQGGILKDSIPGYGVRLYRVPLSVAPTSNSVH
jgi:hypothetical protein